MRADGIVKLSIIIPVFENPDGLGRTLRSLKGQMDQSMELIVCDGGSKDETMTIANEFSNMITVLVSEPDGGWNDAFCKGLRLAKGEYVFMLAAGDVLLPGVLVDVLPLLEDGDDCVCGSVYQQASDGLYYIIESQKDLGLLYSYCSLCNPASFIKKDTLMKCDSELNQWKCANDRERFLRLQEYGASFKIVRIPVVVMEHGGLSTSSSLPIIEDRMISIKYGMPSWRAHAYYFKRLSSYHVMRWLSGGLWTRKLARRLSSIKHGEGYTFESLMKRRST